MNLKNFTATLILVINAPIVAMPPKAGAVIDPVKQGGDYTVALANSSLANISSALPTVTQVTKASTDLFKTKGIPVIITTAAGMMPWWALTTGTGYLLLSQCSISDPAVLTALASGASYAAGEQTNSLVKKCINNPVMQRAAQFALCAACIGMSYTGSNITMAAALVGAAQAIGIQTIMDASAFFTTSKSNETSSTSSSWICPETKAAMMDGAINAMNTIIPSMCVANMCDSNALLRILLYEQAYRLAQSGCSAAQQFIKK